MALGDHEGLLQATDLATLKMLLRLHGDVDAIVTEYSGESSRPLAALAVAERYGPVPRRILVTPRGVTSGVLETMQSGRATTLLFLPHCHAALRAALHAPVPGLWRPRAA
jgi:hypothetical protein